MSNYHAARREREEAKKQERLDEMKRQIESGQLRVTFDESVKKDLPARPRRSKRSF